MEPTLPDKFSTGWNTIFLFAGGIVLLLVLQSLVEKLFALNRAFEVIRCVRLFKACMRSNPDS